MRWTDRPVTVTVPATSANLGPGFDSLGLAVALRDEVSVEVVGSGLHVEAEGEGAGVVPLDERHLVVRAARAAFEALGRQPPGLRLRCRSVVPHGRGLGSSACAIVAGVVVARELVERSEPGAGVALDDAGALLLASVLEGHPDNVAATMLGGLTIAWSDAGGPRAVRLDPAVSAVALVPPQPLSTAVARALLPDQVSHRDAAANSGRAGLLVAALTARPDLLLPATEDRLHQEHRAPAMPDTLRVVRGLRDAGHAAVVSGAGPSVLVLCDPGVAGAPPRADVVDAVAEAAPGWLCLPLDVDLEGPRVLT